MIKLDSYNLFESNGLNEKNLRHFQKWTPKEMQAHELPDPSYNVSTGAAATSYGGRGDRIVIKSKLEDLLRGGGKLYRDVSAVASDAYIISIPKNNQTTPPSRIFIQEATLSESSE